MDSKYKTATKTKTNNELLLDLDKFNKDLINLRLDLRLNQLKDTSLLKKTKAKIAFINTLLHHRSKPDQSLTNHQKESK